MQLPPYSPLSAHWQLNQNIVYLNHGSFGATPSAVLQKQQYYRDETEAEAVDFFLNHLPALYKESRAALAGFVNADANNIVFVPNTTTGVNNILQYIPVQPGDEWLTTSHAYGACLHAMRHFARIKNVKVNVADVPFPISGPDDVIKAVEAAITPNTRFAMIDHITSATGIVFPVKELVALLKQKNIVVLVDAAHAPGMVDFNIRELDPDFYVANCHKWICSPKGSAFMYVAPQHQPYIHPIVISHYNATAEGTAAHWSNQFIWDGTHDFSQYLCVKTALEYMPTLVTGGWDAIKKQNHDLVCRAAVHIADRLGVALPAPENMIGTLYNIPMPDMDMNEPGFSVLQPSKLKTLLFEKYKIEVPIFIFPQAPTQWLRISAQLYNSMEQYEYLADCLLAERK